MNCVLMLALVGGALCYHVEFPDEDHHAWEMFKIEHMKEYNDENEEQFRKQIFLGNLKFVREHNAKLKNGEVTFEVAINRFADLTTEEFTNLMNGYKSPEVRGGKEYEVTDGVDVPTTVDWKKEGAVTAVKDQGQCGSCWAFSAIGSLEGQTYIANKKLVSLSEQNLVDCSTMNDGCSGGDMSMAFEYIKMNNGIDTEKCYPYRAKEGECHYDPEGRGATVSQYVNIPSGNEKMLQAAVAEKGPVAVAIDANHTSFVFYNGGVYSEANCGSAQRSLNHAVLVVGYGTDQKGGDYWMVKNSWGANWGLEGYVMMARNKNNLCGIATEASYPLL